MGCSAGSTRNADGHETPMVLNMVRGPTTQGRMGHCNLTVPTGQNGHPKQMKCYRITTDVPKGGLGLRQPLWACITRWIAGGQRAIVVMGPPHVTRSPVV